MKSLWNFEQEKSQENKYYWAILLDSEGTCVSSRVVFPQPFNIGYISYKLLVDISVIGFCMIEISDKSAQPFVSCGSYLVWWYEKCVEVG